MKIKNIILILLGIILVTACSSAPAQPTPDVNVARTSAVETVVAQFTLTAASFTSTPLPIPTATEPPVVATETLLPVATEEVTLPTLPPGVTATQTLCDSMTFDSATVDVNIPDGTQMTAGQTFTKTWKIKNNGSCAWGDGYKLIYAGYADQMSGKAQPLSGVVAVGEEVQVSVDFKAPTKAGEYLSAWTMANARNIPFGKALFVKITVK